MGTAREWLSALQYGVGYVAVSSSAWWTARRRKTRSLPRRSRSELQQSGHRWDSWFGSRLTTLRMAGMASATIRSVTLGMLLAKRFACVVRSVRKKRAINITDEQFLGLLRLSRNC